MLPVGAPGASPARKRSTAVSAVLTGGTPVLRPMRLAGCDKLSAAFSLTYFDAGSIIFTMPSLRAWSLPFVMFFPVAAWLGLACQVECVLTPSAPAAAPFAPLGDEGHHHHHHPVPVPTERHRSHGQPSDCVPHQHVVLRVAFTFRPAPLMNEAPILAVHFGQSLEEMTPGVTFHPPERAVPLLVPDCPIVLRV